jgi:protocatechuate 3,4-dioxygenase, beta subunit
MPKSGRISRRRVLEASIAWSAMAVAPGIVRAQVTRRTPAQILGPFYPVNKPTDQDADLTQISGRAGRAAGQVLYLNGTVATRFGVPIPGANIEIWQANAHGRYTHVSDRNPAPLDPNFEGYASLVTDAQGAFQFKTIKPAGYPEDSGAMRAPHIHFDVTGKVNRLVTQLFFDGEALNETDRFLKTAGANQNRLIAKLEPASDGFEKGSLIARWQIVLDEG